MQKYRVSFNSDEQNVVRKWRLRSVGFYGSIFAILLLMSAISQQSAGPSDHVAQRSTQSIPLAKATNQINRPDVQTEKLKHWNRDETVEHK